MWWLLAFEKEGERLVREVELPGVDLALVRMLWPGISDDDLLKNSCVVDAAKAPAIEALSPELLDLDRYEYVIEYSRESAGPTS